MTKVFWKSKTFWYNFLTMVVGVATYYGYTPNQEVTDKVADIMILFSPLVNIGLRYLTKQPISFLPTVPVEVAPLPHEIE